MSKQSVENLLSKGGGDKEFRVKYDNVMSKEKFVELAIADGYDTSLLKSYLRSFVKMATNSKITVIPQTQYLGIR